MKILHIVPHAHPSGFSRELDLLLNSLPAVPAENRICCLGDDGPVCQKWRAAGQSVDVVAWQRWLDPRPLWTLARHVRAFQPDIVHAWGLAALRAVRLAAPQSSATLVVRKPLPSERRNRLLSALDRWCLGRADLFLAASEAEALRCATAGLAAARVAVVAPGVKPVQVRGEPERPRIFCAGALLPHKGFYQAIWAFDILHFAHHETELQIAGEGPERGRLEEFAARTGLKHHIHLVGEVADLAPCLAAAAVVWVPALTDSGAALALEAMAAGCPVVASRWPGLAELIVEGETGYLVEPGSKMDLARQTRRLLLDPALRRRLGEAGRLRAATHFLAQSFARSWTDACLAAARSASAVERTEPPGLVCS